MVYHCSSGRCLRWATVQLAHKSRCLSTFKRTFNTKLQDLHLEINLVTLKALGAKITRRWARQICWDFLRATVVSKQTEWECVCVGSDHVDTNSEAVWSKNRYKGYLRSSKKKKKGLWRFPMCDSMLHHAQEQQNELCQTGEMKPKQTIYGQWCPWLITYARENK